MSLTLAQCVILIFASYATGSIGSLFFRDDTRSSRWGSTFAVIGSLFAITVGGFAVALPVGYSYVGPTVAPFLTFAVHVDKLAGMFLLLIAFVALLASIYGYSYMRHYFGKYHIGAFYFFYNLFLGSMMLVILADQALLFLVAWELMALASYFLVVFDHKEKENVNAGFIYFIITHIATAFIVVLFLLFYHASGSFDFTVWRQGLTLSPIYSGVAFILAIIGFGTKAGVIPFHVWLPRAHPAAPSHISALMSGVMIKTGIYMLIRVLIDFFPMTPAWLGILVLTLGAVSSVLGVLYALGEHDIKKLLAYHSIENIGIILLGLGAALLFRTEGQGALAALALAAALFHTANHAIFKSLLFMSAGAVVSATHTRNIEEYGGLIKRMPETALFFLIGSVAISGIVPFNGFVSEWLTFQSLFGGIHLATLSSQVVVVLGIAALAFTGGLAAACFVKAFGVTFLARPRSEHAASAAESSSGMRIGMSILAIATLLLGIFGGKAAMFFLGVVNSFPSFAQILPAADLQTGVFSISGGASSIDMPLLFIVLVLALLVTWLVVRTVGGKRKVVVGRTWDCGFPLTPRMEITATGFSRSLIMIFFGPLRSRLHIERQFVDRETKNFLGSISVHMHLHDVYHKYFYDPIARVTIKTAEGMNRIQSGSTHMYLLYMMVALIALLIWATYQ